MKFASEQDPVTAMDVFIAVNDEFPDATYGAVSVVDQYDAVEAYRAYDDGGLSEAPSAYNAYLKIQSDPSH